MNNNISFKKVSFKNLTPYNFKKFMKQLYLESKGFGESGEIFLNKINDLRVLQKHWKISHQKLKQVKSKQTIKKYENQIKNINIILQDELASLNKSTSNRLSFKRTFKGGVVNYEYSKSAFMFMNFEHKVKFEYIADSLGSEVIANNGTPEKLRRLEHLVQQLWGGDFDQFEIDRQDYLNFINNHPDQHPDYVDYSKMRK